jgi:hypothetical protein
MYDLFLIPKATDAELDSENTSETGADLVDAETTNEKKFSGMHFIDKRKHHSIRTSTKICRNNFDLIKVLFCRKNTRRYGSKRMEAKG